MPTAPGRLRILAVAGLVVAGVAGSASPSLAEGLVGKDCDVLIGRHGVVLNSCKRIRPLPSHGLPDAVVVLPRPGGRDVFRVIRHRHKVAPHFFFARPFQFADRHKRARLFHPPALRGGFPLRRHVLPPRSFGLSPLERHVLARSFAHSPLEGWLRLEFGRLPLHPGLVDPR